MSDAPLIGPKGVITSPDLESWTYPNNHGVLTFEASKPVPKFERRTISLEEMQALVGSDVEHVSQGRLKDGRGYQLFVSEDGRLRGLRVNVSGTEFLRMVDKRFARELPLVGTVVVLIGHAQWS